MFTLLGVLVWVILEHFTIWLNIILMAKVPKINCRLERHRTKPNPGQWMFSAILKYWVEISAHREHWLKLQRCFANLITLVPLLMLVKKTTSNFNFLKAEFFNQMRNRLATCCYKFYFINPTTLKAFILTLSFMVSQSGPNVWNICFPLSLKTHSTWTLCYLKISFRNDLVTLWFILNISLSITQ